MVHFKQSPLLIFIIDTDCFDVPVASSAVHLAYLHDKPYDLIGSWLLARYRRDRA